MNRALSIVLPLCNEVENVETSVASILDFFDGGEGALEILLVDDGSTDGTSEVVDRLSERHPQVEAVHHPWNRGYGGALASGFRRARHETIVFMDADGQFDIAEVEKLLRHSDEADIVAGYRVRRWDPWFRILLGKAFTGIISLLFGVTLRDINCGFKLMRKSMLDKIEIASSGALVNAEILAKAKRLGCTVKEVGVSHFPRKQGEQSGGRLLTILRAMAEISALFVEMKLGRRR